MPDVDARYILIRDARGNVVSLKAAEGVTVGQVALRAAKAFGARVGVNDHATLALNSLVLHADCPLPGGDEFNLVIFGGTV